MAVNRAVSEAQAKFFKRVKNFKEGKTKRVDKEVKRVAAEMTLEGIKEFTRRKKK